jgi:hypothetical protein
MSTTFGLFGLSHLEETSFAPLGGRHDREVGLRAQESREPFAHQAIVFDDENQNPLRQSLASLRLRAARAGVTVVTKARGEYRAKR